MRPYAGVVGTDFILVEDIARPYRARLTDAYLERETILRMTLPARSSVLNLIKHSWDMLWRAVSVRHGQLRTIQELNDVLVSE